MQYHGADRLALESTYKASSSFSLEYSEVDFVYYACLSRGKLA